jgi:hypothetical protein
MKSVTYEPMEGISVDVQDHTLMDMYIMDMYTWRCTHGDMISLDRLDGLHRRRGGRSMRESLAEPYPGGLCHFHQDVGLGSPMMSPMTLMMSSNSMEVLGGSYVPKCHVWHVPTAQEGQCCPKRG